MQAPEPQVLVVCTGNICRSPAAAALLRGAFDDLAVVSAGTHAVVGSPADMTTAAVLSAQGIDLTPHRGAQLTQELVERSRLVLTMTREQRSAVVELTPAALRRTFTLLELARLVPLLDEPAPEPPLGAADPATSRGARLLVLAQRAVPARRPHPAGPAGDDIADPYGQPWDAHEHAISQITAAVRSLASAVAGRV